MGDAVHSMHASKQIRWGVSNGMKLRISSCRSRQALELVEPGTTRINGTKALGCVGSADSVVSTNLKGIVTQR